MSNITTVPSYPPVPYLTLDELKRSPIYGQLQRLVAGGSQADNDAALTQLILRVSAMIDSEVNQNLSATVDTEARWSRLSVDGELRLHTRANPIVSVLSVSVGRDPYNLTPVSDLSQTLFEPWRITIPWQALRGVAVGRGRVWASWTYINGYPVTTLAAPVVAGATSITVGNPTGIMAGQTPLTIQDGKSLETVTPTAVSGNVLTVPPLFYAHQAGVGVNALPNDIQEATLLLVSRLHDSWSMSMGAITHDGSGARRPGGGAVRALCDAAVMLAPYRRVW